MTIDSRLINKEKINIYNNSAPENYDWIQDSIVIRPLRITESNDLYVEVHDEEPTYFEPFNSEWEDSAIWDILSFDD